MILTYSFDPVSNRLFLLDPDNGLTTWGYDQQHRIIGVANPFAELTTISWDALDREQRKTLANGMVVSHTYDAAGRETLIENRKRDGTGLAVFTNTYDPMSNRLTVAELDGTRCTFGYDPTYQLINEQRSGPNAYNTTYAYDPLGNRLSKNDSGQVTNYQYNQANELTLTTPPSGAPTTATFDANGNLALENTGGALTSYSWDPENRLLTVSDNTGITTSAYSADGLRQRKVVGANATNFVWDEQNVLQERDVNLATMAQYTDWPGIWGGLVSQRRRAASGFYGFDSQSGTRVLVSIGDMVTDSYSYKAFGEELAAGSGTVNTMRYVGAYGYQRDTADRLYVRARVLKPVAGRWLSRDIRLGIDGGFNLYAYLKENPARATDPSGWQSMVAIPPPTPNCATEQFPSGPTRPLPRNRSSCQGYYDLCRQGYLYGCNSYYACMNFGSNSPIGVFYPDDAGSQCVRGCLQFAVRFSEIPRSSCNRLYCQHEFCFERCRWRPLTPFNWGWFNLQCCTDFIGFRPPIGPRACKQIGPCPPSTTQDPNNWWWQVS